MQHNVTLVVLGNHTHYLQITDHKRMGHFFLGGLSHLCPKNFLTVPEKTSMLTCKITLPDLPHLIITSKNPGFRALISLDRMNSV